MFPNEMFNQILPEDEENRNLIAFITMCTCQQHDFSLVTFNVETQQRVCKNCFEIDDILTWLKKPPKFIKKECKGIVYDNYCLQDKDGVINYDYRQQMINLMLAHQIPFRFVPNDIFNCMSMLIGANINLKIDETLLQVFVYKSEVKIYDLKRVNFGYILTEKRTIPIKDNDSKDEIKAKILEKSNPKQIIATLFEYGGNGLLWKRIQAAIKSKKLTILGTHVNGFTFETSLEILKHLYDKNETKFHLRTPYSDIFGITDFAEVASEDDIILSTEKHKSIPFTETKVVTRFTKMFYVSFF
uniref:Uncharacterized protein n=1 Tax=Panagrolaimus davidi TaxID=227884 RepID=A0A914Q5J5_9BILA